MNCPVCGRAMELNRHGTFWYHTTKEWKPRSCPITSIPHKPQEGVPINPPPAVK